MSENVLTDISEYLIQGKTLQSIANKIRVLSGSEDTMTPVEMESNVETFCNDIDTELSIQDDLIAQIIVALQDKITGSIGVKLPVLSNPAGADDILSGKEAINGYGKKITGTIRSVKGVQF